MWIYDILNAFMFFMYRLLELLYLLLTILFMPFVILINGAGMPISELIPYINYTVESRLNRLRTFSFTLKVSVQDAKPNIHLQHYDDDTDDVTKKINSTKFSSIRTCITEAMKESRGYSYLIFQSQNSSDKFIQLRMDTGFYLISLPLTPLTLNRDYSMAFIKLLYARGYRKINPDRIYIPRSYSIEEPTPNLTVIQANLGQDSKHAVEFCTEVLTNIFNLTSVPNVVVG